MTRSRQTLAAVILTVAGAGALATAPEAEAAINARQRRQQARIEEGRRSGELTRGEYLRLQGREARIRREERRFRRSDGVLGPRERAELNRDLDRASRRIHGQKHDGQER